jgi:hypothetical protein
VFLWRFPYRADVKVDPMPAIDSHLTRIERDFVMLQWMVGSVIALLLPFLWLLLHTADKLGAL